MTYPDILDVCEYIVNHDDVSEIKLQKLLYFIQAYFLATTGEPCFEEDFEAWGTGPVIPAVYKAYGMFGSTDIPQGEYDDFILPEDKERIDQVIEHFKDYAGSDLVTLSICQSPWIFNYQKGKRRIIPKDDIYNFFTKDQTEASEQQR